MDTQISLDRTNVSFVAPLYIAVFNAAPWHDGWTEESAKERLIAFSESPRFQGIAAVRDGKPVAFALGWGERWTTGWHFHLKEMCVAAEAQGKHVGSLLLASLEARLAGSGFSGIYLQTGKDVPARGFYEKNGFRELPLVTLSKRVEA